MSKHWNLLVLASLALSAPAFAGTGAMQGACTQEGYAFSSTVSAQSIDPYSYLLPNDLSTSSLEISNSYQIDLPSLRSDDMSKYQFEAVDNRSLGAGYASPYLWEVGRGPGGGMMSPTPWGGQMDGRAYSPVPMPGR
jgi:hypothetical protein